jgi:hypothetical protein
MPLSHNRLLYKFALWAATASLIGYYYKLTQPLTPPPHTHANAQGGSMKAVVGVLAAAILLLVVVYLKGETGMYVCTYIHKV